MSFSYLDRTQNILDIQNQTFDLAIIGGGINGAGVARDAASRGMKVALVEGQDFAEGTSSRSSKLIHGGIRYLENLEFGLVFEALSERRKLFELAPHLVHPLRFILPVYKNSRVGMFKLGLGMWLYDLLSAFEAPKMHERFNRDETLENAQILNPTELVGSYAYSDAYMDDDRLVLETLRSAAQFGAKIANYTRAVGAVFTSEGQVSALRCRDEKTKNEFVINAKHFISTVGPWTDVLAHNIFTEWKNLLRLSKGVHLTFEKSRINLKHAIVMVSDDQKRIVFAIPRNEMVIIGTTDTDYSGDPGRVQTQAADVEYLLKITNEYFPGAKLVESDIVASYSGVRPLVYDGAESEGKTSREHLIFSDPRNVTFLTGGKYTTYRKMAEDTMTVVLDQFSSELRMSWRENKTLVPLNALATREKIIEAQRSAEAWAKRFGLDVATVNFFIHRHGYEALSIIEQATKLTEKISTAHHQESPSKNNELLKWQIEAQHAIRETMCMTLCDFYLRRIPLFNAEKNHGYEFLEELSKIFQNEFKLSEVERSESINAVRNHASFEMGWRKSRG